MSSEDGPPPIRAPPPPPGSRPLPPRPPEHDEVNGGNAGQCISASVCNKTCHNSTS